MARTGRPKIDGEKRKAGIFNFRVSESELALIERAAANEAKNSSAWAREIILAKAAEAVNVKQIVGGGGN